MSNPTCTPDDCKNRGPRGGLCKRCWADRSLLSYYANREARNEYNRAYRAANPERIKRNFAEWYKANADKQAAKYLENRERHLEYNRKRRAANPGAGTQHSREWRKRNPEKYALRNRENSRRRQTGQTASRVAYAAVLERDGMVCHICTGSIADLSDLHFDHVMPLARGGAHHADNIKPAHALCNMRKSDKIA
jgi:5-methylcytosine-specific restriction endonuclease McrA